MNMKDMNLEEQMKGRPVSIIKLDEATRRRMAKELQVENRMEVVPAQIRIVRVSHEELGIEPAVFGVIAMGDLVVVDA